MPENSKKARKFMVKTERSIVSILKIGVDSAPEDQLLTRVDDFLDSHRGKSGFVPEESLFIVTPNPEIIVFSTKNSDLATTLNSADLSLPDGVGILLATFPKIASRVAGADFAKRLVERAKEKGWRVCLLGGDQNVSSGAKNRILQDQKVSPQAGFEILALEGPRLNSRGEPVDEANRRVELKTIVEINKFEPHLLFVGFGPPKQERWVQRNRHELEAGVIMVVGGTLDFWSGRITRAPFMLRQIGLEWLWRLIQEPSRWRRQLALVEFMWLVLKERFGLS